MIFGPAIDVGSHINPAIDTVLHSISWANPTLKSAQQADAPDGLTPAGNLRRWAEQKNQTRLLQIIDNMETLKTISFLIVLLALMLGAFNVVRLMLAGIHKFSFCLKTHFGSFQIKRLYINGINFGMVRFSFNDEDKMVIYSKFIGMILLRFEKHIGGYQIYHDHEVIVVSKSKRLHNEIMINLSISKR